LQPDIWADTESKTPTTQLPLLGIAISLLAAAAGLLLIVSGASTSKMLEGNS